MPSISLAQWSRSRAAALDEIAKAHSAVGGTQRGRRYATQQINQAYAVLLASQFQGFCRDLHSECVDYLVTTLAPPPPLRALVRAEFTRGRQLDTRNAQPSSIAADFGRLGLDFWVEVESYDAGSRKSILEVLNRWRNAIAHQDFDPSELGGRTTLHLGQVRQWRSVCERLARTFDEVMRLHLKALTGASPW